jgi:hypothetical protein
VLMKITVMVVALLALSCLVFMSVVAISFQMVHDYCPHQRFDFLASTLVQTSMFVPNDPGSGGGGTGVIR